MISISTSTKKKDNEILEHIISELVRDFDALNSAADAAEVGSTKRLATLANSRNRLGKTIAGVLLAKSDPRYFALADTEVDDLASMLKRIRESDSQKQPLIAHKSHDDTIGKRRLSVRKKIEFGRRH